MIGVPYTDANELFSFMFAGKAVISVKSLKTNKHYTYQIRKHSERDVFFVSRLARGEDWMYYGMITNQNHFRYTNGSSQHRYAEAFIAFDWFFKALIQDKVIPEGVEVYHEGKCGACGLPLTDPESISTGYGPTCRKLRLRPGTQVDMFDG